MNGLSALVSPVKPSVHVGKGRIHLIAKQRTHGPVSLFDAPSKRVSASEKKDDRIRCAVVMLESGFTRLDVEKAILFSISKSVVLASLSKMVREGFLSSIERRGAKTIYSRVSK